MNGKKVFLAILAAFVSMAMLGVATVPARAVGTELAWFTELPAHPSELSWFWGSAIALGPDTHLYVTVSRSDSVDDHQLTMKYDPWGNRSWLDDYPVNLRQFSLAVDASGNAVVAGQYRDEEDQYWGMLLKYDSEGNRLWEVVFEGGIEPRKQLWPL